ncbi:MAG: hypothetical protein ABI690_35025 [Chloroflexota bacterium]
MPVNITWDDEAKTTIICKIEGGFALPTGMADAFSQVDAFAKTVEHQVGAIMDWTDFQPFIPDNPKNESQTDGVQGRRGILRGDFGSSGSTFFSSNRVNVTAFTVRHNPQQHKIAITVFVLPDAMYDGMKDTLSQMISITENQARFAIASSLEEAREIINNHFQQGNTDQKP